MSRIMLLYGSVTLNVALVLINIDECGSLLNIYEHASSCCYGVHALHLIYSLLSIFGYVFSLKNTGIFLRTN